MHKIDKMIEPSHFIEWKRNFAINHGRLPLYEDLIGTEEYKQIKSELLKEQGYLCCYCENEIGRSWNKDCDIEHFMPRHPDKRYLSSDECEVCRNAQLDYSNLMVSCLGAVQYSLDHCNHKKDNWFDFTCCISPISEDIEGIFGFRANGKIFAVNNNHSAEEMKKHLNLDTYVLREQRMAAYDTVLDEEFGEYEELWTADNIAKTISIYKEKDENGKYVPFMSMITYCLKSNFL